MQLQTHIPTRSYQASTVRVLFDDFFHVEVDNLRVDRPAPQVAKLVHLIVSKAAAILYGGCKHESCCKALKKGTRVCLYSPSVKAHNFAQIRYVSNLCITLYEMNLILVIDRYDLLVVCRPFSICRVYCMELVKTNP